MLPIRLTIQAFGPYVEKQCVDFASFTKDRLFLIEGETGSGKTMLLDAMTYALYGKSSGGQREDLESMRSRFAPSDVATIVDFEFSLQGRYYRFIRTVEVRKKRNQESALRVRVDAGELLDGVFHPFFENPKLRNVEEKAEALIGLSYAQFVQVMLLPQGKFEQFLTSRSEEKQEILKTLFQMERWSNITAYLQERLMVTHRQIEEKKLRMKSDLQALDEVDMDTAQTHYQELQDTLQNVTKERDATRLNLTATEKQVLEQKEYHRWQEDLRQKQQMQEAQLQQQETMKERRSQCKRWKQMQQLRVQYEQQKRLDEEAQQRLSQYEQAIQQLQHSKAAYAKKEVLEQQLHHDEEALKQKEQQFIKWQEQLVLVQDYEQQEKLLHTAQAQLKQQQQTATTLQLQQQQLQEQREQVQQKRYVFEQQQPAQETLRRTWQLYEIAHPLHEQMELGKQKQQEQAIQVKQLEEAVILKHLAKVQLQQEHEVLYEAFLAQSALQLAEQLKEGEPCPVCGSLHHPNSASLQDTYMDVLELREKKQALETVTVEEETLQRKAEQAKTVLHNLMEQQQERAKQIQELLQQAYTTQAHVAVQQQYEALQEAKQTYDMQGQQLQELQQSLVTLQQTLEEQQKKVQEQQQLALILQTRQQELKRQLPERDKSVLETDVIQLKAKITTLSQTCIKQQQELQELTVTYEKAQMMEKTTAQEWQKAKKQQEQHASAYEQALQEQHVTAANLEQLPKDTRIEQEATAIQQYFLQLQQMADDLASMQEKLSHVEVLDVEKLLKSYDELYQHLQVLQEELAQHTSRKELYERILTSVRKQAKELQKEEPAYLRMQHFVRAMRGDNSIGIERYVLGILLDSITTQANRLLEHIHEGRYQIFRSNDTTGRTRKFGLELAIYDTYSMEPRNVVSLSGGEKFLVSLAMSLALSLVVQARNGGIHFDCLFIDEGFGTLDEHSIADALAILQTMTQGKGMIGIISHVEILKENIQAGIAVTKTKEGSTLHLRKGD